MTYMILETHTSYCVAVDEGGRFIKAANMGYEVGQTVGQIEAMKEKDRTGLKARRIITLAGSLAACLLIMISLQIYQMAFAPAFASVYMSINPAVRIDVSKNYDVVSIEPVNEDGAALLEDYEGKRKAVTVVSDELVDRAIAMGFLSEGGMVRIDIDAPDEAWFQKTEAALSQNLKEHLRERMSVTVEVKRYDQASGSRGQREKDDEEETTGERVTPGAYDDSAPPDSQGPAEAQHSGNNGYKDKAGAPAPNGSSLGGADDREDDDDKEDNSGDDGEKDDGKDQDADDEDQDTDGDKKQSSGEKDPDADDDKKQNSDDGEDDEADDNDDSDSDANEIKRQSSSVNDAGSGKKQSGGSEKDPDADDDEKQSGGEKDPDADADDDKKQNSGDD